jgi:hypothetical protein
MGAAVRVLFGGTGSKRLEARARQAARIARVRPYLSALRAGFRGTVLSPYDPGYEEARVLFNTRVRTAWVPITMSRPLTWSLSVG